MTWVDILPGMHTVASLKVIRNEPFLKLARCWANGEGRGVVAVPRWVGVGPPWVLLGRGFGTLEPPWRPLVRLVAADCGRTADCGPRLPRMPGFIITLRTSTAMSSTAWHLHLAPGPTSTLSQFNLPYLPTYHTNITLHPNYLLCT